MFVNVLIRSITEICRSERFLEWLQILMFMDDSIIINKKSKHVYQVEDIEGILQWIRYEGEQCKNFFYLSPMVRQATKSLLTLIE